MSRLLRALLCWRELRDPGKPGLDRRCCLEQAKGRPDAPEGPAARTPHLPAPRDQFPRLIASCSLSPSERPRHPVPA